MNVDERLRTALRDAVSGRSLDEEHALQAVRARVPASIPGVEVDPVDVEERPRRPARGLRLVALLAACVLLAGAVAIPFALRSTRKDAPTPAAAAPGRCGHDVTSGYRSTALVRMAQETPGSSGPRLRTDPVQTALGLCDAALSRAHPRTDEIQFAAESKTPGDLSLVVSTPRSDDTAALARAWAHAFAAAVRADVRRQIVEQQNQLAEKVRKLHDELRRVDTQLATLAPNQYHDVVRFDSGRPRLPGSATNDPPPIPENGSVEVLNLAFERISILDQLTKSSTTASELRIKRVKPEAFATVASVSAPTRFPASSDGSGWPLLVVVIGVLVVGALLAAGGFLLSRRSRRPG